MLPEKEAKFPRLLFVRPRVIQLSRAPRGFYQITLILRLARVRREARCESRLIRLAQASPTPKSRCTSESFISSPCTIASTALKAAIHTTDREMIGFRIAGIGTASSEHPHHHDVCDKGCPRRFSLVRGHGIWHESLKVLLCSTDESVENVLQTRHPIMKRNLEAYRALTQQQIFLGL